MEIISKKSSFPILGLIILESFVMFLSSVGCGWIIYHFLPNLFEVDFLFSIKASVLGMLFLGWILFCPKCISQKIWGLMLISLSGGIFFSIFFYIYGIKCCLWACALIVSEFVIGLLLGSMFKNKISASLFLKIVAFIFIPTFLIYAIMVFCSGTFFCYEPIYVMFMLLGLLHLTFIYSKKEQIIAEVVNSSEKRYQNKFVIFFYLSLFALAPFIECSRIILLIYYQILHLRSFNKN